jgi:hypothetical protein
MPYNVKANYLTDSSSFFSTAADKFWSLLDAASII